MVSRKMACDLLLNCYWNPLNHYWILKFHKKTNKQKRTKQTKKQVLNSEKLAKQEEKRKINNFMLKLSLNWLTNTGCQPYSNCQSLSLWVDSVVERTMISPVSLACFRGIVVCILLTCRNRNLIAVSQQAHRRVTAL